MPSTPRQEVELIRRAAQGDRDAFSGLVARYQRPVINFAFRYLGNREEAEDAAQDAFVRVYFSLARLREPAKFTSYLFTTALNVCRTRASRERQALPDDGPAVEDPQAKVVAQAERERVAHAIAHLPLDYRLPVALRVNDGLSFAEIGEVIGATEGACRVRYHRAKEMLRAALSEGA